MSDRLDVRYSCRGCGVVDVVASVPARRDGEDVVAWMRSTTGVLALHHHLRRKDACHDASLAEVKIPLNGYLLDDGNHNP